MLLLKGLQQGAARLFAAPGAARHLIEQLKRALGGARIAIGQADIGVHHADQSQKRKIMALGDQLRADDEIELMLRHRLQFGAHALGPARHVGGQNQQARVGKKLGGLLGQSLDPRPAGVERIGRVAGRAFFGPSLDMAAMMADQGAAVTMLDQPRRAIRDTGTCGRRPGTGSGAHSRAG